METGTSKSILEEINEAKVIAIDECIDQEQNIKDLVKQIDDCDGVLENLEGMLSCFLNELGTISSDMKRLKEQSVIINQQLNNRQRVRGELSQFVDDMVVPHSMIKTILERDAGSTEFLEQLHELQHKLNFVKAQQFQDAKAVDDVQDVIENLKFKAMEKIRIWLLLKIEMLKKPFTNYQIPQAALLKNRFFYEFLLANDRNIASEVKEAYIDTVGKIFFSYLKEYASRLFKLQMIDSATKSDLLGAEDQSVKPVYANLNLPNLFSGKTSVQSRSKATVFSLGNRLQLLTDDLMAPLIVPNIAQESHETFQFESLFRSLQYAVIDHSSHEYLFICDFFIANEQLAIDLFNSIMGRTISYIMKVLEDKISVNHDAISLFICICLCKRYSELLKERRVVAIENYFDSLLGNLWNRLEYVMEMHTESLRNYTRKSPLVTQQQQGGDTRPYYIIRRYAELTSSLLVCAQLTHTEHDNRLQNILSKQQTEIEHLINRLATQLRTRKDQLTFQINNYDVILSVLNEKINTESKEKSRFQELLKGKVGAFIDELYKHNFSQTIHFLDECELVIEQKQIQLLSQYTNKLNHVLESFNKDWKNSMGQIQAEILQSFTNFKNGANIIKIAAERLIQLHERLNEIASMENFQLSGKLIDKKTIENEFKAYQPSFLL